MGFYRNVKVPDCLFESSNDGDVPDLRLDMQATYPELGVIGWGRLNNRNLRDAKTVHFYNNDQDFSALLSKPQQILSTRAVSAVEPNFSLGKDTPAWFGHYYIYMKRYIARLWQEWNVRIYVDLNVSRKFKEANLVGVPLGWRAFANRGYNGNSAKDLLEDYYTAETWAQGKRPFYLVIGGNLDTRNACKRYGWFWIPEAIQSVKGCHGQRWHQEKDAILTLPKLPKQIKGSGV